MVCGFLYVSSPLQRKEKFVLCPTHSLQSIQIHNPLIN
uniref:Uncharacterized protein n=1 Tax=Arundo donax TaxID=35708 RepID=A0A0A9A6I2_ARUDO